MKLYKLFLVLSFLFITTNVFAQQNGSISGQVYDSLSQVIPGASVVAVNSKGVEKRTIANRQGEFQCNFKL
nr:carboxypeptidase-like regulatory domain-containing protein [Pyrinomonadaceae bacterium]